MSQHDEIKAICARAGHLRVLYRNTCACGTVKFGEVVAIRVDEEPSGDAVDACIQEEHPLMPGKTHCLCRERALDTKLPLAQACVAAGHPRHGIYNSCPCGAQAYPKPPNIGVAPGTNYYDHIADHMMGVGASTAHVEVTADPINPKHYRGDLVARIIETFGLGFNLGNVAKYILRHKAKAGLEDLKKAKWYLEREIAEQEGRLGRLS